MLFIILYLIICVHVIILFSSSLDSEDGVEIFKIENNPSNGNGLLIMTKCVYWERGMSLSDIFRLLDFYLKDIEEWGPYQRMRAIPEVTLPCRLKHILRQYSQRLYRLYINFSLILRKHKHLVKARKSSWFYT